MRVKWDDICNAGFFLASVPSVVFGTGKTSNKCLLIGSDHFKQMVSQEDVFQKTRIEAGIGGQKLFSKCGCFQDHREPQRHFPTFPV